MVSNFTKGIGIMVQRMAFNEIIWKPARTIWLSINLAKRNGREFSHLTYPVPEEVGKSWPIFKKNWL